MAAPAACTCALAAGWTACPTLMRPPSASAPGGWEWGWPVCRQLLCRARLPACTRRPLIPAALSRPACSEAVCLDPQARMLLEHTQEALAAPAATAAAAAVGTSVGVYIGCMYTGALGLPCECYQAAHLPARASPTRHAPSRRVPGWRPGARGCRRHQLQCHCRPRPVIPGWSRQLHLWTAGATGRRLRAAAEPRLTAPCPPVLAGHAPSRLAYSLCLQGPCVSTDTACSSSPVALHMAHSGILAAESAAGLAGGVNTMLIMQARGCAGAAGRQAGSVGSQRAHSLPRWPTSPPLLPSRCRPHRASACCRPSPPWAAAAPLTLPPTATAAARLWRLPCCSVLTSWLAMRCSALCMPVQSTRTGAAAASRRPTARRRQRWCSQRCRLLTWRRWMWPLSPFTAQVRTACRG